MEEEATVEVVEDASVVVVEEAEGEDVDVVASVGVGETTQSKS